MDLPVFLILVIGGMWLMSIFARRQQKKMAAEQERRTEEALVPGTWVRTTSGFYGTVVEVDGDAVTLASPLGDETLWAKRAIAGAEEPPFASTREGADEDGPGAARAAGADDAAGAGEPTGAQAEEAAEDPTEDPAGETTGRA